MPPRLTRPAVVLSVAVAAVALLVTPLLAAEVTRAGHESTTSVQYGDTAVQPATSAVARIDPRDSVQERAAKHRLALVAVLTTLLGAWLLLEARTHRVRTFGSTWPDTASPFQGRAPPRLSARCA